MIIETALVELAKAGGTELFLSSSESLLKKVKTAKDIKQLFINTGKFFVDYENDADQLFDDMANVLSIVLPNFSLMSSNHALKEAKPASSLLNANGFLENSMFLQSNALA